MGAAGFVAGFAAVDDGAPKSLTAEATMRDGRRVGVGASRSDGDARRAGTGTGTLRMSGSEVGACLAATAGTNVAAEAETAGKGAELRGGGPVGSEVDRHEGHRGGLAGRRLRRQHSELHGL